MSTYTNTLNSNRIVYSEEQFNRLLSIIENRSFIDNKVIIPEFKSWGSMYSDEVSVSRNYNYELVKENLSRLLELGLKVEHTTSSLFTGYKFLFFKPIYKEIGIYTISW